MHTRTYGWVQNPADFKKLKLVVQIFDSTSEHYLNLKKDIIPTFILFADIKASILKKLNTGAEEFTYTELVGTSRTSDGKTAKYRAKAVADSLIQVTVLPQNYKTKGKCWTDNWTADGYLRWALSLNFVEHDRETDLCRITELGREFSKASSTNDSSLSQAEVEVIRKALLSYPPATRVLSILKEAERPVSKFYIGQRLGFKGERGFTSYEEKLMEDWLENATAEDRKKIKTDIEGTSDKYGRMIAGWLSKVGFIKKSKSIIQTASGKRDGFPQFEITGQGIHALNQARGSSKNQRTPKYITWEFLAVGGANRDYVRMRRAYILKIVQKTKSFKVLLEELTKLGFLDNQETIKNDLKGLNTIGIDIKFDDSKIILADRLNDFSIPELSVTEQLQDAEFERRKAELLSKTDLPAKYYELLEIAYTGSRNRDFEIMTLDLFINMYGFEGKLLGGGRRPDGVIFTSDFGVIIDTKAYSTGYSKNISQEDEMVRYITDNKLRDPLRNSTSWWDSFTENIPENAFHFLWVSSEFVGKFSEQLQSTSRQTGITGGALNVKQLLLGANLVKQGALKRSDLATKFTNEEIFW